MSVQASTRVMDYSEAAGVNRLVLLVMANRAGGDFDECFASVDRLAFECRVDVRTVQRAVKRLVGSGDLVPAGIHPKHRTNVYRVMPAATVQMFGSAGVAESHPPVPSDVPAPPERKELGVRGSSTASSSSHPTFGFAEFYAVYPRHEKPREAERAYKQALKRATAEQILAGAIRYAEDPNLPVDKSFISHPASWLNGDGWLSEPLPARVNGHQRETQEQRLARLAEGM